MGPQWLLLLAFSATPFPREGVERDRRFAKSSNAFGFSLFRKLASEPTAGNVFVSPLSVSLALGMAWNGAAGKTREEMQRMLGLGDASASEINESFEALLGRLRSLDPKLRLQIANSIWSRQGFPVKPEFVALCRKSLDAEARTLDFGDPGASKTINGWVDRSTNGKIREIVPDPLPGAAVLYLIDAVYFKGAWSVPFDPKRTREDLFKRPDGSTTPCRLMQRAGPMRYLEGEDFQAVDLPYGDRAFGMIVWLPKLEIGLDVFIQRLDPYRWEQWRGGFAERDGDLFLPRFTFEYERTLNDSLRGLGMTSAFDPSAADLSGIADPRDTDRLFVSEVKHKTFVEVNEEGTEAAAATSVEIRATSIAVGQRFLMRVDRPFAFAIYEKKTGAVVFIGKVVEPKA